MDVLYLMHMLWFIRFTVRRRSRSGRRCHRCQGEIPWRGQTCHQREKGEEAILLCSCKSVLYKDAWSFTQRNETESVRKSVRYWVLSLEGNYYDTVVNKVAWERRWHFSQASGQKTLKWDVYSCYNSDNGIYFHGRSTSSSSSSSSFSFSR